MNAASEFIKECIRLSTNEPRVEVLDCDKSYRRKPCSLTVDEVLEMTPSVYPDHFGLRRNSDGTYEAGVRFIGEVIDYFIWSDLSPEAANTIAEKYKDHLHS